jgi:magnesium chelatase subunit I
VTFPDDVNSPSGPPEGIRVLPYSRVVGNDDLKAALEISYLSGLGVLASGQRGTAKSTTIRAFSLMAHGDLPVTLPIGVTEDRVLGGWSVRDLLAEQPTASWEEGLLVRASTNHVLYIDEVNLLDDHIVNLVLDAVATGILTVHRDNADRPPRSVDFAIIGSMNPSEGPLRPQLLDRFGLVVTIDGVTAPEDRALILRAVLEHDRVCEEDKSAFMTAAAEQDAAAQRRLKMARDRYQKIPFPKETIDACARVSAGLGGVGHRGEIAMARAAKARAALEGVDAVRVEHLRQVAKFALVHRRPAPESGTLRPWNADDQELLDELIDADST